MVILFHRRSPIHLPRLILMVWDVCAVLFSVFAAVFIRLPLGDAFEYIAAHPFSLLLTAAIFLLVFYASGMYEPDSLCRGRRLPALPLVSVLVAAALTGLLLYTRPDMTLGRGIWLIAALLVLICAYAARFSFQSLVRKGYFLGRSLILGDSPLATRRLLDVIDSAPFSPYLVKGIVTASSDPAAPFIIPASETPGAPPVPPVIGTLSELPGLVERLDVSFLMLALSAERSHEILPKLRHLRYTGVELLDFVSIAEEISREIPLSGISDEWLMMAAMNSAVLPIRRVKRLIDVVLSLVALVPGLPLLLLAGALVKLTSKGPMIYRQRRVGLLGKPYTLFKLRTMCADAEASGAVWARQQDMRVTPVGYYLRKWRIDEIPQLFNVLKGEMSLVGPRPERPEFTEKLAEVIPFYNERTQVLPGLTGWAQVKYPYTSSFEASARKLQFDLYYIKNMNPILDLTILLRTIKTILVGLRYEEPALRQTADGFEMALAPERDPLAPDIAFPDASEASDAPASDAPPADTPSRPAE